MELVPFQRGDSQVCVAYQAALYGNADGQLP